MCEASFLLSNSDLCVKYVSYEQVCLSESKTHDFIKYTLDWDSVLETKNWMFFLVPFI
jgi:hypothetical protein